MSTFFVLVLVGVAAYVYIRSRSNTPRTTLVGRLPGPGTYEFDIVGESKYQNALEAICGGKSEESAELYAEAILFLEDSNPYDSLAVRVEIDGETVGYLSRDNARSYRRQLKRLGHEGVVCSCDAKVVGGWYRSRSDQGHFGVKLDLPVA